jgi:hypothetical protein
MPDVRARLRHLGLEVTNARSMRVVVWVARARCGLAGGAVAVTPK